MKKHLVSIDDLSKDELVQLMEQAEAFSQQHLGTQLRNKIIASLFFEPSTRTRLSFESAAKYLSGQIIGFASGTTSSEAKGESLEDTIRVIMNYCDLIVIRHPASGSAARAAAVSKVPIINAGDGANEHPTQTLLDLFSVLRTQGTLEGLDVAVVGDLKYSRTIHSFTKAMSLFGTNFVFTSAPSQRMPTEILKRIESGGGSYTELTSISGLSEVDILYINRTQKERFASEDEYQKVTGGLQLTLKDLDGVKDSFRILDPLPRVDEIAIEVDDHPAAYYFEQVRNGLYIRQALLAQLLSN